MDETSVTQALIDLHEEANSREFGQVQISPPYFTPTPAFDPDSSGSRISLQDALDRLWAQMGIGPGPLGTVSTVQEALDDIWAAMNGTVATITFDPQEIPAVNPLNPTEYFALSPSSVSGLGGVSTETTPDWSPGTIVPEELEAIALPATGDFILLGSPSINCDLVWLDTDQLHRFGFPGYLYPRLSIIAEEGASTGLDPFVSFFVARGDPDPYDWDGFTLTMRHIPFNP